MATPEEIEQFLAQTQAQAPSEIEQILAQSQAQGRAARAGANTARESGMESLREAMAAGQPTAQSAWTTAIAGALPALLGKLFGGDRGLQAGAEGGLIGAGTSIKLDAAERARRQKALELTGGAQINAANLKEKEAGDFEMGAAKAGLDSAQNEINNSERMKQIGVQEAGANNRLAMQIAARGAGGDKPLTDEKRYRLIGTETDRSGKILSADPKVREFQTKQGELEGLVNAITTPGAVNKASLKTMLGKYLTGVGRHAFALDQSLLPKQVWTDYMEAKNYWLSDTESPLTDGVRRGLAVELAHANIKDAKFLKSKVEGAAKRAVSGAPYLKNEAPDVLVEGFDGAVTSNFGTYQIPVELYKYAKIPLSKNPLWDEKSQGIRPFDYHSLMGLEGGKVAPNEGAAPTYSLEEIRAAKAKVLAKQGK